MHKRNLNFCEMTQHDFWEAIYNYYSSAEPPACVADTVNTTIEELQKETLEATYIETTINDVVSIVDVYAFQRGFYACLDILSGNVFRR